MASSSSSAPSPSPAPDLEVSYELRLPSNGSPREVNSLVRLESKAKVVDMQRAVWQDNQPWLTGLPFTGLDVYPPNSTASDWEDPKKALTGRTRLDSILPKLSDEDVWIIVARPLPTSQHSPQIYGDEAGIQILRKIPAPSSYEASWPKYIDRINHARFINHQFPFPTLIHPIFGAFVDDYKSCEIEVEDMDIVKAAMEKVKTVFYNEASMTNAFNDVFSRYICRDMKEVVIQSSYTTDSSATCTISIDLQYISVILLNREDKNQPGHHGDAHMQNVGYYIHTVSQPKYMPLLQRSVCPCFLLDLVGPTISVSAAYFQKKVCIAPLTPIHYLYATCADPAMIQLARLFRAIKNGINALEAFYQSLPSIIVTSSSSINEIPYIRLFPYIHHFPIQYGRVSFKYKEAIQDREFRMYSGVVENFESGSFQSDVTENEFRANVAPPNSSCIIIKFVRYYGTRGHQILSESSYAPTLYCVQKLAGGWFMVIMALIADVAHLNEYIDVDAAIKLREAINLLHGHGYVHGDVRGNNVLVSNRRVRQRKEDGLVTTSAVYLIDFDWCGLHGTHRYPCYMNKDIRWPDGVGPCKLMKIEHDVEMLNRIIQNYSLPSR